MLCFDMQVRSKGKLARICLPEQPLHEGAAYTLRADDAKHVTRVLRHTVGDRLEIVDGSGHVQEVEVAAISKHREAQVLYP
jgi:16S rRNA U1498 N3-methylase RsmE